MQLTYLGHSGWRIEVNKLVIYIDPFKIDGGPKANILLITHDHYDHLDPPSIAAVRTPETVVISTRNTAEQLDGIGLDPEDQDRQAFTMEGLTIRAVAAYNREKNYHSRGYGIGFVVKIKQPDGAEKSIYHAGDTDYIEEMDELAALNLDVALLPIGGTYTMDQREAVQAALAIKAKLTIPLHFNTPGLDIPADPEAFIADLATHGLKGQIVVVGESITV